jgi:hypothetical protein
LKNVEYLLDIDNKYENRTLILQEKCPGIILKTAF